MVGGMFLGAGNGLVGREIRAWGIGWGRDTSERKTQQKTSNQVHTQSGSGARREGGEGGGARRAPLASRCH